jgi:hypothetical protein
MIKLFEVLALGEYPDEPEPRSKSKASLAKAQRAQRKSYVLIQKQKYLPFFANFACSAGKFLPF